MLISCLKSTNFSSIPLTFPSSGHHTLSSLTPSLLEEPPSQPPCPQAKSHLIDSYSAARGTFLKCISHSSAYNSSRSCDFFTVTNKCLHTVHRTPYDLPLLSIWSASAVLPFALWAPRLLALCLGNLFPLLPSIYGMSWQTPPSLFTLFHFQPVNSVLFLWVPVHRSFNPSFSERTLYMLMALQLFHAVVFPACHYICVPVVTSLMAHKVQTSESAGIIHLLTT